MPFERTIALPAWVVKLLQVHRVNQQRFSAPHSMRISRTGVAGGGVLATIHLLVVACIYRLIVYENNSDAVYGWLLLLFVDFPVSMGMGIRSMQIDGDYIWNNGTLPGLYFGIIGTAWWFVLGYIISWMAGGVLRMIRRKSLRA